MTEEEIKIYHILCNISKICKNYFFERKYLPDSYRQMETVVKKINNATTRLNKKFEEIKIKFED